MFSITVPNLLAVVAVLAVLVLGGLAWWRHRRRLSPDERERARRLAVNTSGRLTDGVLVDSPYAQTSSATLNLVFYRYSASGVEYTAAQDVSNLADRIQPGSCRPGSVTSVKYDPRKPSNSIVVCEQWSGFREDRAGPSRSNGGRRTHGDEAVRGI
ncbi:MAG: hypothetical protein HY316_06530 [Acidobacteria bacterium]|nr:hypothetical protein [Acidobacteriota bacterium]